MQNLTLTTILPIGISANVELPNITVTNTTIVEAVPVVNVSVEQQNEAAVVNASVPLVRFSFQSILKEVMKC